MWTFRFVGGTPFSVTAPHNPAINHDGRLTIAHLICEEKVAEAIVSLAEVQGCEVLCHTEGETRDQVEERRALREDGTVHRNLNKARPL